MYQLYCTFLWQQADLQERTNHLRDKPHSEHAWSGIGIRRVNVNMQWIYSTYPGTSVQPTQLLPVGDHQVVHDNSHVSTPVISNGQHVRQCHHSVYSSTDVAYSYVHISLYASMCVTVYACVCERCVCCVCAHTCVCHRVTSRDVQSADMYTLICALV